MSPHRAARRASWAMVAGVVAIIALVFSVWLVGERTTSRLNQSLLSGCSRAVARDYELWATNRDLRDTARRSGDALKAATANARMVQIKRRLPASDDVATVAVFCRRLFPG